jgi:hypothetical protein
VPGSFFDDFSQGFKHVAYLPFYLHHRYYISLFAKRTHCGIHFPIILYTKYINIVIRKIREKKLIKNKKKRITQVNKQQVFYVKLSAAKWK